MCVLGTEVLPEWRVGWELAIVLAAAAGFWKASSSSGGTWHSIEYDNFRASAKVG